MGSSWGHHCSEYLYSGYRGESGVVSEKNESEAAGYDQCRYVKLVLPVGGGGEGERITEWGGVLLNSALELRECINDQCNICDAR